jgi:hypothetical protein
MKLKIKTEKVIKSTDWDKFVKEIYGRPYCFQQQNGCVNRGVFHLYVPQDDEDFSRDTIPEVVNGCEKGVSFKAWLERDPKKPLPNDPEEYCLELWWHRNFYPDIQTIANDLCKRGLLKKGEYLINIDW